MPRPPSSHGKLNWSLGGQEGDIETSSPRATPISQLPAATSSPRPSTKRRHRKKGNRVGPATDGYDSTDQHTRHKPPLSRQSRGRSQRGRPFTQQSLTDGGGRASRSVANDTQRELAWLDTGGGGVQLMRFQPIPPPTYSLPPHPPPPAMQPPQGAGGVIQVQPRPQKGAKSTSLAQEKLPTLQSAPQSQSYTQRQLETYFKVCCIDIPNC